MTRYRIGLVGDLDHLRPHLMGANFNPCGGPFGHAATSEVDSLLQRGLKTPLLVSARPEDPTWKSWMRRLLDSGARMAVIGDLPAELQDQRCKQVSITATLAEALLACGAFSAMVPENLAGVLLTAPEPDRFESAPTAGDVNATQNGSQVHDASPVALPEHPVDYPVAPRRSVAFPVELDKDLVQPAPRRSALSRAEMEEPSAPQTVPVPQVTSASAVSVSSPVTGIQPGVPAGVYPVEAVPAPAQPASVTEIFDRPDGWNPHAPADIIIVFGARGGLGKTSIAQAIAGTAAERGRRTVLVDTDKGQSDQALLLRLDPNRPVPSAYDTARTGRPDDAIASPVLLNELRGARRDRVSFALVAAPPESIPGAASITTPGVYRNIIDHAARLADLIIVDTHPMTPSEPSDMVTELILPLLRAGAWGLGLTDSSIPGLKHLEEALDFLIEQGVPQDRLMTVINRVPASANLNMELLGSRLSRRSHWIGPIFTDDEDVQNRSNAGIVLVDVNAMAHQVESVLNRACGLEVVTGPPGENRCGRLGLFRLFDQFSPFGWGR